jgi:hypothetical protein
MTDLINLGFRLVFNYTYDYATKSAEIFSIQGQCTSSSVICVGGNRFNESVLRVVACVNCLRVTQTNLNQPQYYDSAYWYFTQGKSFGYAPNSTITQNSADSFDNGSNKRLSWHLDQNFGGWRLGDLTSLNSDKNYYKIIYINENGNFKYFNFII